MANTLGPEHVLCGLPTYDGTRYNSLAIARLLKSPPCLVNLVEVRGSVLAYTFNSLWCAALNNRGGEKPITHFLLWHADIKPVSDGWLRLMLDEMKRVEADVLSAVVPIKNDTGLTSTAQDTDLWAPNRYTMTEVHRMEQKTWTTPDLLLNTGLMLVDLSKPWIEKVRFTINDKISYDETTKRFKPNTEPEDWNFSRQCHALGVKLYATSLINLTHVGAYDFPNQAIWGFETDAEMRSSS